MSYFLCLSDLALDLSIAKDKTSFKYKVVKNLNSNHSSNFGIISSIVQ
jgi:hypothetical protein